MNPAVYKKFKEGLKLRGYADKSQEAYIWQVKKLSDHYLRSPDNISDEELRQYLLYLLREKKYVRSTLVNVTNALRHFYKITCNRSTESLRDALPVMRKPESLPRLYSQEEITRLLCAEGLRIKQRTMLITAYASGLRVSEVCRLKVTDILSSRKLIFVEKGKGAKDRYAVLSPKLLNILRNYWRFYRPPFWLFPSPVNENRPIHPQSMHQAFKHAVEIAGLPDRGGIHSLRHSFATHAYESGVELPALQCLLGHKWLSSTTIYLHVSQQRLDDAKSPFDQIDMGPLKVKAGKEIRLSGNRDVENEQFWHDEPVD